MGRRQDQVTGVCDQAALAFGIGAPQQKHHGLLPLVEQADHLVGEQFPAFPLVGIGRAGPHGEYGVEQQHPLLCPIHQAAVGRGQNAQIIPQLLVDVHQRRRDRLPLLHRKAEPLGLSRPVIGVLPQYDHLYL